MNSFDAELYACAVAIMTRDNDAGDVSRAIHDYQAAHDFAGGHTQYFRQPPSPKAAGREAAIARLIEVGILIGHPTTLLGGVDVTLAAEMRNDALEMAAIVEHSRRSALDAVTQYSATHPAILNPETP